MKKILLMICLLILPNIVYAYENDYFTIDVKGEYKEMVEENDVYKWNSNNDNELPSITITVTKNNSANLQNIEKFKDSDLEKYKKTVENTINEGLSEYNLEVSVGELKKEKINDYTVLTYMTTWPTKDSFGYDMYQKSYVITTENYITTLVYTTTNESEQNSKDFKSTLSSFKINDSKIIEEGFFAKERNQIIVVGATAGLIGYVISAIKKKKTI